MARHQAPLAFVCVVMLVATAAVASPCRAGDCARPVTRKATAGTGCCDKTKATQDQAPRASLDAGRCDCCASARLQLELALPGTHASELDAPALLDGLAELGVTSPGVVSPRVLTPQHPRPIGAGPPGPGPHLVGTTILLC